MAKPKFSCRIVFYTVIGLALTGVALWDAHLIINDFITDNRLTVVKVGNVTYKYPFLRRAQFCITYIIRPFSWIDTHEAIAAAHKKEQAWSKTNATDKILKVEDVFIALLLSQYMRDIDKAANTEMFTQKQLQILNMTKPEAMTLMDSFVASSSSIDLLTDIWRDLRPMLAHRVTTNPTLFNSMNAKITLDKVECDEPAPVQPTNITAVIERIKFCFFLPISEELTAASPIVAYNLDMLPAEGKKLGQTDIYLSSVKDIMYAHKSMYQLQINDQMVQLSETTDHAATVNSVEVIISNSGIFDASAFPPCSAEFSNEPDCLADVRRRAVQEVCQCTQFTEETKAAFNRVAEKTTTASEGSSKSRCTTRLYEQCLVQAMEVADARVKEVQQQKACTPCLRSMNTFQVVESKERYDIVLGAEWAGGMGSNAGAISEIGTKGYTRWSRFTFRCPDSVYVAFEDKQQFNLVQLIAQVGGNMGLYTGFSMLTIVELILLFYNACQTRHSKQSDETIDMQIADRINKQFQQKIVVDVEQLQVSQRKLVEHVESIGLKVDALLGGYRYQRQMNTSTRY